MTKNILSEKAIESKLCNECGKSFPPTAEFWYRHKGTKGGFRLVCKICTAKKAAKNYIDNKEDILTHHREYYADNKKKVLSDCKKYRDTNKEKVASRHKRYRSENKEKILERGKKYYKLNKGKVSKRIEVYRKTNKQQLDDWRKEYSKSGAKSSCTMRYELSIYDEVKDSEDGAFIEVKCAYCGKWMIPTNQQVASRLQSARGTSGGELRIYCSDGCKSSCPTYNQIKYPKKFRKATSRESNPVLRQLVLKRDNYKCQKCGVTAGGDIQLHCHHVVPATQNPMTANDPDNCTTLCKECHKAVHKIPGCGYYELRCSNAENTPIIPIRIDKAMVYNQMELNFG